MTTRRDFIRFGLTAGATAYALPRAIGQMAEGRRPNIIFVFSDDHAAQAISAYGSRINRTPNIDRLATEGVLFENCFCTNSICGPSRATVLTGTFSHVNGFYRNGNRFDGGQITYPKELQKAGYQTAMIGKWHLKTDPTGFDYWRVLPGQGAYYNPDFKTPDGTTRIEGYCTDIIADLSLEWLKTQRDPERPFLLHCWHKAPHRPWQPGPTYLTKYDGEEIWEPPTLFDDYSGRTSSASKHAMGIGPHMKLPTDLKVTPPLAEARRPPGAYRRMTPAQRQAWDAAYAPKNRVFEAAALTGRDLVRWKYQRYIKDYLRCIASVDDCVGRILGYLDEVGLADNTIVVYSSDQGFYLGEHGWFDKRWMYEESLRMPLLMRWPGRAPAGLRVRELVQNIDFGPTFLAASGAAAPERMQGVDVSPLLQGRTDGWRQSIYYHYYEFPGAHSVQKHCGVRTATHKLIHFYPVGEWELYDLRKDPMELNSVYDDPAYAEVVQELKAELERLQVHYGDDSARDRSAEWKKLGFPVARHITGIRRDGPAWLVTADADDGAALMPLDPPRGGTVTFRCRLKTALTDGIRNGLIALAPNRSPGSMIRCGVYIRAKSAVILGPGNTQLAGKPMQFDETKEFDVAVRVDTAAGRVRLTVDGSTTLEAALPPAWKRVAYYGFGLNKTTTRFSSIEISP